MRTGKDIVAFHTEAFDKVWLMHSSPYEEPDIEQKRVENVRRILDTYNDIPEEGYTDWECGYWNGILVALHWVLWQEGLSEFEERLQK